MRSDRSAKVRHRRGRVSVLLTLSACTVPGFGPDPEEAVDQLAEALSSGDVNERRLRQGRRRGAHGVQAAITEGMGKAKVSAGEVSTEGDSATGQLDWSWKVGVADLVLRDRGAAHQGRDGRRRRLAGPLEPRPGAAVAEARRAARRDRHQARARRHPRRRATSRSSPSDRCSASASTRRTLEGAEAKRSASSLAQLVDVDAKAFVKQVTAAGPKAFVQAIVYRRNDVPADVLGGLSDIKGARAISDRLPLAPTKDFAVRDPRHGRTGDRRAGQGQRRPHQGRGRRRPLRPAEEVRRAARRHPGSHGRGRRRGGRAAHAVHRRARSPASHCARRSTRRSSRPRSRRWPTSALGECARRDPALDRRPGRGGERTRLEGLQHRDLRPLRPGLDLQGGQRPRAAPRRRHPADARCPARPRPSVDGKSFKNYDDYPSSGLGEITFEDALANSCNTAFISQRDKLDRQSLEQAAASLGLGVDHDPASRRSSARWETPGARPRLPRA